MVIVLTKGGLPVAAHWPCVVMVTEINTRLSLLNSHGLVWLTHNPQRKNSIDNVRVDGLMDGWTNVLTWTR